MGFKLIWDAQGAKKFEAGTDRAVLYPIASGAYPKGVEWNEINLIGLGCQLDRVLDHSREEELPHTAEVFVDFIHTIAEVIFCVGELDRTDGSPVGGVFECRISQHTLNLGRLESLFVGDGREVVIAVL